MHAARGHQLQKFLYRFQMTGFSPLISLRLHEILMIQSDHYTGFEFKSLDFCSTFIVISHLFV